MKPYGYFEPDGSYNEREYHKPKPRPPQFAVSFDTPIADQLLGRIDAKDGHLLDDMVVAMKFLRTNGGLPETVEKRVRKQITLKAERCVAKFRKRQLSTP